VVFVDDEVDVVDALRRTLRRERPLWNMIFLTSAAEALQEIRSGGCALLMSDLRMPHMNGVELLTQVKAEHPKTLRCVLSGYAESDLFDRAWSIAHVMLTKPCESSKLRDTIIKLLGDYQPGLY
jgi:DNA-binding NtrC family response regulator